MSKFLKVALDYQKLGLCVIPLSPGSKEPAIKWKAYQSQKSTEAEIVEWWGQWPNANIGIVTGKISDLSVIDLDRYKEGYKPENEIHFKDIITVSSITPRKGSHLYFKNCGLAGRADILPGIDLRCEGNYIVAPPSVNGSGNPYQWADGPKLGRADLPALPEGFIAIYNNLINYIYIRGDSQKTTSPVSFCELKPEDGSRNQYLFHIAHTLFKGGSTIDEIIVALRMISKELNLLSKDKKPQISEAELLTITHSAKERFERKERNYAKEVDEFILVSSGEFTVSSCYRELVLVSKEQKAAARQQITKRSHGENPWIEKTGQKDGVYRKIEKDFEFVNFLEDEAPEKEFDIRLPLGLNDLVEISQANIILVAGEFNSGKTTFLLNILKDNKGRVPIRYMFSEGGKSELKKRFNTFGLPFSFWVQDDMTEYIRKSYDFHSAISPEAVNIIDYMEFRESEYHRGAEYMTQIQDKLTTGIAIIAIQKKEGQRMPRAGDMVLEKPRLGIAFSKLISGIEFPQGSCEILKAKAPKLGKADGKKCHFEILNKGSKFRMITDWNWIR